MATIRTKAELLVLMADNSTHDITPQVLRDFVISNNVQQVQTETSPVTVNDDTDFFIADVGCIAATLPLIASFGERTLQIANASGGDLVVNSAPFETIDGQLSVTVADGAFVFIGAENAGANWVVIINTGAGAFTELQDTPSDYSGEAGKTLAVNGGEDALEFIDPALRLYQIMCGHKDPDNGDYLKWFDAQNSDDAGYCVIRDGTIVAISINRTDTDDANFEIRTPSGDNAYFSTDNQTVIDPVSIAVSAGDLIRVRNIGPNKASNVTLSLLIEED